MYYLYMCGGFSKAGVRPSTGNTSASPLAKNVVPVNGHDSDAGSEGEVGGPKREEGARE